MLTAGDALAKTLAKSQKVTFGNKNIALDASIFRCLLETLLAVMFCDSCWWSLYSSSRSLVLSSSQMNLVSL